MSAIHNFQQVSGILACAGQPNEGQLPDIAADGYQVVVNLGLTDGKYALADEAASVTALGMAYHHIPVLFDNPQIDELELFTAKMNEHAGEKILVHCAANYRASVFTGLYLLSANKMNEEEMQEMIEQVWQPDAVWQQFIEDGVEYLNNR
ncbi:MAG TPA: protein tyrosine phosphatase family protein [Mucilaginibacter sp.]|nr:protein tyrosine phosphatase family protein [Mucilaginibacter sp.]